MIRFDKPYCRTKAEDILGAGKRSTNKLMKIKIRLENLQGINKDISVPLYHQLIDLIKKEIKSGRWQTGQQIPTESELCGHFDISRSVVRQAIRELQSDGLLKSKQGKGTFVARHVITYRLAQNLIGFYEDMIGQGAKPTSEILKKEVGKASAKVADALQIDVNDDVIVIERLRFVNNEPLLLVTNYLPYVLCNEILATDLSTLSLYTLLETHCGITLSHGQRVIHAVAADARQAKLLRVKLGAPLISFNGITYMNNGRPIEEYFSVHRGDRGKFEVNVLRDR